MFTAATFQLIRKNSSAEFETLLNRLGIETDWSDEEFRVYEKTDGELTEKICDLLKSPTIIDGYMNLLDLGGVTYNYSETDSELLGKIVVNKDKILDAVRIPSAPENLDVLTIEADTAKPFDNPKRFSIVEDIWNSLKRLIPENKKGNSYYVAYHDVEAFKSETEKLNPLLELDGNSISIDADEVADFVKRKAELMHDGEEQIICLKIKKRVDCQKPFEPPKSEFTLGEAEEALRILAQLNEIISLAR